MIIGFNIEKIIAEKTGNTKGRIDIKNKVSIKEVTKEKILIGNKNTEILHFHFIFELNYEPKIGHISINGFVPYLDEAKNIKEIIEQWKKNKKVKVELMTQVINTTLFKCHLKALELSQEVNLPLHIPLPKLTQKVNVDNYIG